MGRTAIGHGVLENATIAVPLKYVTNFSQLLKMPLISCKVKLKITWSKTCILATHGNDNNGTKSNNIIFTIKNTKLSVPVVNISAKNNQKLSKLLSKRFENSLY